ncbi:hypothetical protein BDV29DRAFT_186924 [Aspergillus leporis]|uniref:Uncharacterized protein n=1 Tax=Aspergillus leporis TaxID=41062 RepID=A0A5N5WIQ4_9EURO|nr:hypothetical protein BDV29DRAFT_186924 [Aspergillus leporis]
MVKHSLQNKGIKKTTTMIDKTESIFFIPWPRLHNRKASELFHLSGMACLICTTSVSLDLRVSPWVWRVWRLVAFYPGPLAFLQGYILSRRAPGRSSLQPQNDPHVLHATGVS